MLISLPSFHLISPIFASLLTVSWWAYWQRQWENLSHEQDAPEVPTTGSTLLLIQLEGMPAPTRDGLMNHPFSVLKLFLPIVHYILCSLFCWRVSFKRSPPLSFPHGQIFLLKWISPISIETFCFSHFRKKRKIKKKFSWPHYWFKFLSLCCLLQQNSQVVFFYSHCLPFILSSLIFIPIRLFPWSTSGSFSFQYKF